MNDYAIATLGPAQHASPVRAGAFVADTRRVLIDVDASSVSDAAAQGRAPASLEAAGPREHLFFDPTRTRAAIVTCGGLCPGINDVVRSLVLTLWHHYGMREIWGVRYGLSGFVSDDLAPIPLDPRSVRAIHRFGGSILASSRGEPGAARIAQAMHDRGLQILFLVGGDGTMRAAQAIEAECRTRKIEAAIIGIPKTVDNDIPFVDRTFGFDTAVAVARQAIDAAHVEALGARNGVGLVKLMGRHAGFIAAYAALASGEANFVLIPEVQFTIDGPQGLLAALERRLAERRHAVVVVAEGAGQELLPQEDRPVDASGNAKLGDIGGFLRTKIERHFRDRQLPVTLKYIDPSYTIRSAPAIATDAIYAQLLGQNAAHAALAGKTALMVGRLHGDLVHVPLAAVTAGRRTLAPSHAVWHAVEQCTGQPAW